MLNMPQNNASWKANLSGKARQTILKIGIEKL